MKRAQLIAAFVSAITLLSAGGVSAQSTTGQSTLQPATVEAHPLKIIRAGSKPFVKTPSENFTGNAFADGAVEEVAPSRLSLSSVTFEPGARTAWHTHPLGQTLVVTNGIGLVQAEGGPVEEIRPGDVVRIPPNTRHWHGATANTSMTHFAIQESLDGKRVTWMERVNDGGVPKASGGTTAPLQPAGTNDKEPVGTPAPSRAQALFGDIAPKLAELTDDVLFGDVWERPGLSKRDRSLVTVSALIAMNRPDQLRSHLALARRNGLSQDELVETITHLAFYAGWPSAVTAATVAKEVLLTTANGPAEPQSPAVPLGILAQGSFAVGGTVVTTPGTYRNNSPTAEGQSFHGDHLYVAYQVPQRPKPLPIVMLHGAYQSARSWETTPDGREGFQTIFLRRGFPVYLVDQPRRGRAGNSTVAATVEPVPNDQLFFDQFRIGKWPNYFENVQFDRKPETLDQFLRSVTPNTGPYDTGVISDAMSALFTKIGPAILFSHSQGGGPGWLTAIKNPNVKAIVAFEPGSGFIFPHGELPDPMPSAAGTLSAEAVSFAEFEKLTRIPIVLYYGDNFPAEPTTERGQDNWRVRLAMARLWVDAINKHGGRARLVHLPEVGIRGNTHFVMSDLNNVEVAGQVSQFLTEHKLD